MKQFKVIITKAFRILIGAILGLIISLTVLVVCNSMLGCPDMFILNSMNLWLVALLILVCELLCIWLALGINTKRRRVVAASGFEQLPAKASRYIDAVITSMNYKRKVSEAVKQELTDHFTDALSECSTQQDKDKYVEHLIKEFGDVELIAKLLKRGKKRCATPAQKVLRIVKWAVILIVAYPFWAVAMSFLGRPNINVNYLEQWNNSVLPVVEDSQNAEPLYTLAVQAYNDSVIDKVYEQEQELDIPSENRIEIDPVSLSIVSEEHLQVIKQYLQDNTHAIELIKQGSQKPYYWRHYSGSDPQSTELMSVLVPDLSEYKSLARLMCWQALFYADQGSYDESIDTIENVYGFGLHIKLERGTLVEQLVGISIKALANRVLCTILNDYQDSFSDEQLAGISDFYSKIITQNDFIADYSSEKYCLYDETQRCFVESWIGPDYLYLPRIEMLTGHDLIEMSGHNPSNIVKLFFHPSKKETLRAIEGYLNLCQAASQRTPASRVNWQDSFMDIAKENMFLAVMLPALDKVNEISYRSKIETQATLTIIALIQYKRQFFEYPSSLNTLVEKGFIKEIPIDPFSDKPLIYKKTDDDFILYSVGTDLTDDGGIIIEKNWYSKGDAVFWPTNAEIMDEQG